MFLSVERCNVTKATAAVGNRWLAAASQQCAWSCILTHAEIFGETSNLPGDSAPLRPRFGALRLPPFPRIKIAFEREETSDHQRHSGKYDGAADGGWGNCVRPQGAYFEGDGGIIVLSAMFLVSSSTDVSTFHIYMAGRLLDGLCTCRFYLLHWAGVSPEGKTHVFEVSPWPSITVCT